MKKTETGLYVVTNGEKYLYDDNVGPNASGWTVESDYSSTKYRYETAIKLLDNLLDNRPGWYVAQVVYEPIPGSRMTLEEAKQVVVDNIRSWFADTEDWTDEELLDHYANIVSVDGAPGALKYSPIGDPKIDRAWHIFLEAQ